MKRSLKIQAFNVVVCPTLFLYSDLCLNGFNVRFSFRTQDIPDTMTFFFQLLFLMICEDLLFHICHRVAHLPFLYPYFHKVHHNFINTVSIAAEHFHPVDYFVGILLPGALGPTLLGSRMHFGTYLAWIVVRAGEGVDGHCGYEFPWSPFRLMPFSASASYHDFHHSHNVGNYSSLFTIWDSVFGANAAYIEYEK